MLRERRSFTLVGAAGPVLREDTYRGRKYLVVPVVALVGDAVIRALGSRGPELVPSEVLEASTPGWSGRPVMADHPVSDGGRLVTANDPRTLERQGFGQVFFPTFRNGRLEVEAWLDRLLAQEIGDDATSVFARLDAKEAVEVSVGASVFTEMRAGEMGGRAFESVWLDILPDHLAMLRPGVKGACSNEMGCGVRAARYQLTTRGLTAADESDATPAGPEASPTNGHGDQTPGTPEVTMKKQPFAERLAAFFDQVMSTEVETPEPKAAQEPAAAAPCACGHKEAAMAKSKQERAKALIENPKSGYKAEHQAWLESAPEDVLTALEGQLAEPVVEAKPPEEKPKPEPVVEAPKPKPEGEAMVSIPASEATALRAMAADYEAAQKTRKAALVAELKGAAAVAYTEAELQAMSVDQLERVGKLMGTPVPVDHSLRRAAVGGDPTDIYRNPPDPWALAMAAKKTAAA